jgi:hypothetical protein
MKRGIALAVVGLLGMLVVGPVSAHQSKARTKHVPTTITHNSTVNLGGGKFLISGQVISHREVCQMNRLVKVFAIRPSGTKELLDLDGTSDGGAWAVKGYISGADRLKAKVARAKFSRRIPSPPRGLVCDAASIVWPVE